MIRVLIVFLVLLVLYSCGKDATDVEFIRLSSGTTQDLSSIDIYDGELIAVGGDVFFQGVALQGRDQNWITLDSLSDKRLFGIDCNQEYCAAVGQDGYYYIYTEEDGWTFIRLAEWDFQRAISITPEHSVSVSGKSFELGHIYHFTKDHVLDTVITLEPQMQDVAAVNDQTFVAVGYGTILRSNDGGYNWTYIDQEGDFYHSVDFVDERHGIIVGQAGSILITTDGGLTWEVTKSPASLSSSRDHFLSVKYINQDDIYIVGDNGLLWHSTDAGANWDAMKVNTNHNLNDFVELDGKLYLVGDDGYLGVREL